ncbi:hypothetical protein WOLCODRAFT_154046 [Wolfiporia cocos MD-104 SS10]|uniref:Protein kinase domain-containing protein n=1 Tax=Wolfiporia cocos (strain MD-104) TaxID=742152 RepID=A0A2H3JP96_WOLCO|nr:hypothetical protein WOLCODRAFT_154046 [Wolfiporia cocos MD-104 SS10]
MFLELVANTDSIPDSDALDTARKLLEESSKSHPDEGTRQKKINDLLAKFLAHDIVSMRLSDSSSNDGMIRVHCQKIHVNVGPLFLEYKSEPDSVNAGPCMQAAFGYARYYLVEAEDLLEYCCCPSFTLTIAGTSLQVSGVVIVDEMLVQDLMHPLCLKDAALPPQHFLRVARVLDALKVCTQQLHSFYEGLEKPLPQLARHLLPSFTSYTNAEGQDVRMEYLGRVRPKEESSRRALFMAETEGGKKEKVVVKFVHQYGERGHRLLTKEGLAPALHYFASLGGGTYVVVMEFVTGDTVFQANSKSLSLDVLADIE